MRTLERTTAFKKDLKREKRGRYAAKLEQILEGIVELLIEDKTLTPAHRDHSLSGNWNDSRECHLAPDLLLIYRKPAGELQLVRLGSHSELFG